MLQTTSNTDQENIMEYPNLVTAKMAELVDFFNANSLEQVKGFKNKDTAVQAVQGVIARLEGVSTPEVEEEQQEIVAESSALSLLGQLTSVSESSEGRKTSTKNEGVWNNVKMLFDAGKSNKEALLAIHEMYGNTNTSYACIAWYRNKYNKSSSKAQVQNDAKVQSAKDFAEKHGLTAEALTDLATLLGIVITEEAPAEEEAPTEE